MQKKIGNSGRFHFLGIRNTADGDCNHEIKRCLLLGRKAMINLGSTLKSRDITMLTKVHIIKAMVFSVVISQSVQSLNRVWLFATPWTAACQVSLAITNPQSLLKLISTELLMLSNHLILCFPLLLLPSISPSIRVSSHQVPKILAIQFQHHSFQWIFLIYN